MMAIVFERENCDRHIIKVNAEMCEITNPTIAETQLIQCFLCITILSRKFKFHFVVPNYETEPETIEEGKVKMTFHMEFPDEDSLEKCVQNILDMINNL